MQQTVSWIHFGDLHISNPGDQNHCDFLELIEEANLFMRPGIAFVLLPGDNADDGEADQYELVGKAVSLCRFPVYAIPGDHDTARGNLDLFRKCFPDALPRSVEIGSGHFVFLNSVSNWRPPAFGLGAEQMAWLRHDLSSVGGKSKSIVVFMHAYPSEHQDEARELSELFRQSGVSLVEMGHTHYNELANDGQLIYAATRSTGQIEEGPVGFSVTTVDGGVISWKFKPKGEWPLIIITSPADERLIVDATNPAQLVRATVQVRARIWGEGIKEVAMALDGYEVQPLAALDNCTWAAEWDSTQLDDGAHTLSVTASTSTGQTTDSITVLINQEGEYRPPPRRATDYENTVGEWRDKHILGTELGPNENGRHWPSRHEAESANR
jgi:3',5'-cyclic AMP phosphodiesterase CpdA